MEAVACSRGPSFGMCLRWYAHNRGYDGNARWSRETNAEDTEKEETANSLMKEKGTTTMAETFCAVLDIEPLGVRKSSRERFKGLNAAFPREVVYSEVKKILEKTRGDASASHAGTRPNPGEQR